MTPAGITRRAALALVGIAAPAAAMAGRSVAPGLWLVDPSTLHVDGLSVPGGGEIFRLGRHVVRQWRDGLRADIGQRGAAVALVRWDNVLLLSGLARESGFAHVVHQMRPGIFWIDIHA